MKSKPDIDILFSMVYEELRRLAYTVKRHDQSVTLNATALVNETWLKLKDTPPAAATSPVEFKRIAVRAMRQVLVDAARRRNADKRGGGVPHLEFVESLTPAMSYSTQIVALDEALKELERVDPRRAAGVEARYFGGYTAPEVAALLEISEETVSEDWRDAKAWLGYRLRAGK